ncbi:MAG: signal peptidase I [Armatimonadetes bacterium]|nr:signal peptidase I [Armatimonadota bacterium]
MVILLLAAALLAVRVGVRRIYRIPASWRSSIVETLDASIFAALLSLVIITFVVQAFYIPSGSMEPSLQVGDRILVSKFTHRAFGIRRGDIVVFRYPLNPGKDFVKRVVALPGERVQLKDGVVLINGRPVQELYPTALPAGDRDCTSNYGPTAVQAGQLFVLGDNRCNSEDSRFFGFVPMPNVIGKALVIYWPLHRIGLAK